MGEFIYEINRLWDRFEKEGHYTLFTFGIIGTDPVMHTYSRVPGEARFCLDTRCVDENIRRRIGEEIATIAESISRRYDVRFEWGPDSGPNISRLAEHLQQGLCASAKRFGILYKPMASGAGHDASAFSDAGIPSGMLFVRNQHGSHNKDETMRMDDLESACIVLIDLLCTQFHAA